MLHFSPLKTAGIALALFLGFLFSLPNFLSENTRLAMPEFLPSSTLNLGLDLQGGSHLLLSVDTDSVQRERLEDLTSDVRLALRGERIGYTGLGRIDGGVTVTIRKEEDKERAQGILAGLAQPITANVINSFSQGLDLDVSNPDGLTFNLMVTEEAVAARNTRTLQQSIEIIRRRAMVSGERLVDASVGFDPQTNAPEVNFRFDSVGAKKFGEVTKANVGRPFAIVLDEKVISAPIIQTAILGGAGRITGNFSVQEANDLAILLRAGALPAPMSILEERTVGPGLGADSVAAGRIALIIGFLAVIGFMVVSYNLFGVYANIALIANLLLIMGVLSGLQATLTLPGIAGIVLTVGMAVDANVLIFERIREEIAAKKNPIIAIDTGYNRALGTILDANITTLLAAVILFQLGSGPIRGFAVTLAIGIVTSVFTAFVLTRFMIALWVRRQGKPEALPI